MIIPLHEIIHEILQATRQGRIASVSGHTLSQALGVLYSPRVMVRVWARSFSQENQLRWREESDGTLRFEPMAVAWDEAPRPDMFED